MRVRSIGFLVSCLLCSAGLLLGTDAQSQGSYPTESIKILVPFPPGSAPDVITRVLAKQLPEFLAQPVVVENRPGAGGIIAVETVARAAPDGYTLLMGTIGTHALNVAIYGNKLKYDPAKDFVPVSQVGIVPHVVLIDAKIPATTMKEFLAIARSKQLNYASAGSGSGMHLATELMNSMANLNMLHVPYKGPSEAMTGVISGDAALTIPAIPATLPLIKDGRVRAIAVTSSQRSEMLPDVPTMAEVGFVGFDFSNWSGIFAPAGTSPEIVNKLALAIQKALQKEELRKTLSGQGVLIVGSSPEAFKATIQADVDRWSKVARSANIEAN